MKERKGKLGGVREKEDVVGNSPTEACSLLRESSCNTAVAIKKSPFTHSYHTILSKVRQCFLVFRSGYNQGVTEKDL